MTDTPKYGQAEALVRAGFDDPVEIGDGAPAMDQLLAFTGRRPQD